MTAMRSDYLLSQLDVLEAESIHVMREVAAEFERPVLLFSGGKDSIVMLALAERAFGPARIPFPVMHIDTGHNFSEVLDFRDLRVAELGIRLIVASGGAGPRAAIRARPRGDLVAGVHGDHEAPGLPAAAPGTGRRRERGPRADAGEFQSCRFPRGRPVFRAAAGTGLPADPECRRCRPAAA